MLSLGEQQLDTKFVRIAMRCCEAGPQLRVSHFADDCLQLSNRVLIGIESGGELAVLAGHLFLTVFVVADPVVGEFDGPETEVTRRRILDELDDRHGLLLLPLVGGPAGGAGVVERDGDGYRLVSA